MRSGMFPRAPRERRSILKQWPPLCVSGECDQNKGCVCIKRKRSAAQEYWDTVQIIYERCEDIPATRPGGVPTVSVDLICHETLSDSAESAASAESADTFDLTCHETLDETLDETTCKRVSWNVTPRPQRMKNGVRRRWESLHVVLCIEEEFELSHHDETQVWAVPPPEDGCYEEA